VLSYPASIHVTTAERGANVAAALGASPALAMQGHGAVTVANTPEEAVVLSLCLERAAAMRLQLGTAAPTLFPATEVQDGSPSGLPSEEMFRTAWHYFDKMAIDG
jgi:ribulose-5-phosphate 4-epimerase/fuculose-1-phosphate aldolase